MVAGAQLSGAGALSADGRATVFAAAALAGLGQLIASGQIPGEEVEWWNMVEYCKDLDPIIVYPNDSIGKV